MSKNKPIPPMYPKPDSIRLCGLQIVSVDKKTRTVHLQGEGSPPPALLAAIEAERRRLDLTARLTGYAQSCLMQIMPHFGERPKYISAAKWRDNEQRVRLIRDLPDDAPAHARDALMAVKTISRIADALMTAGDYPDEIDRAICLAIDLGQLLQRNQTQIDYGETVDAGKRNVQARNAANQTKRNGSKSRSEVAESEFNRRMSGVNSDRMKTATLKNMSKALGTNRKLIYGSLATLNRYAKTWKSIKPPK